MREKIPIACRRIVGGARQAHLYGVAQRPQKDQPAASTGMGPCCPAEVTPAPGPESTEPGCDSVQSGGGRVARLTQPTCASLRVGHSIRARSTIMNNIVYIVGLVVIVLFILGFFGLR